MRDSIESVGLWRGINAEGAEGQGFQSMYYGEKRCKKDVKCLKDLTAAQIQQDCENVCENGRNCAVVVYF